MRLPVKSIMWFIALACIAVGIGVKIGVAEAFIFFGVATIFSLFLYAIIIEIFLEYPKEK